MKILILADRRLRTEADGIKKITAAFLQGLNTSVKSKTKLDLIIEKIHINPCKGCNSCWQGSKTQCDNIGDMPHIKNVFQEANLVIWSLPLFYFGSPSIMKAFVGLKPKQTKNEVQKHVVISIGSFLGHDNEAIDKQFNDMYKNRFNRILCPQGELFTIPQMQKNTDKYLLIVKKAGIEYAAIGKFSAETEKLLSLPIFNKEAYLRTKPKR